MTQLLIILAVVGAVWLAQQWLVLHARIKPMAQRSQNEKRRLRRFDNIATARTLKDMLRAYITRDPYRFERSAAVRVDELRDMRG